MKITIFVLMIIFSVMFFLTAIAKGNDKDDKYGILKIIFWVLGGFSSVGIAMRLI